MNEDAIAKLASSWAHLGKTTKGATAQKRNPDGSFVSQTSEWSQAWKDYQAALAELAPPPPSPATLPTIGRNAICSGCAAVGDHSHYSYVFLNEWDAPLIPGIKAKNPNAKVLVYKCMASIRDSLAAGVQLAGADESWFAHRNGARIEWPGFPGHWQARVNSLGYRDRWFANVLDVLDLGGWDGVIVDNANMTCPGGLCDEYPTQVSYQAATREFLADIGWNIQSEGFRFIPNIQHHGSLLTEAVWRDWLSFCSGAHLEHYTKWGDGSDLQIGGAGWESSGQAFMRESQRQGKPFLATVSCPMDDVRSQTYARCSFLMEWDGASESALFFETNPLSADPWNAEAWRTELGKPSGEKAALPDGAWRRYYEYGIVYVNPTSATWNGSVTLPPMTGLVVK